jgi:hypothetical protein
MSYGCSDALRIEALVADISVLFTYSFCSWWNFLPVFFILNLLVMSYVCNDVLRVARSHTGLFNCASDWWREDQAAAQIVLPSKTYHGSSNFPWIFTLILELKKIWPYIWVLTLTKKNDIWVLQLILCLNRDSNLTTSLLLCLCGSTSIMSMWLHQHGSGYVKLRQCLVTQTYPYMHQYILDRGPGPTYPTVWLLDWMNPSTTEGFFFWEEQRIILDHSWVHRHVTSTLEYTKYIQNLII